MKWFESFQNFFKFKINNKLDKSVRRLLLILNAAFLFVFITSIFWNVKFEERPALFTFLAIVVLLIWFKITVQIINAGSDDESLNELKTGFGYDVHKLKPGAALVLCATKINHPKGLDSFSDGDVAIHALIDALLGAASLGDIGLNFPDSNPEFENISSLKLLERTINLLQQKNLKPAAIDLTIVAQKPVLNQFFAAMKANLAPVLNLSLENISIKATTEEGLGFTGTEQGIKAFCVATIKPAN